MSIKKLPHWVLVDKFPAFYDAESKTTIQQTARLYGKINELIESYNKFIDLINTEIGNYQDGITKDFTDFKNNICKIITDYMYKIDTQIVHQDRMIEEVYDKFKNHMEETVDVLFQEMQDTGELETIIENSVSEFIENLKSSLVAEVTTEVESVMNTVVSNAKNDVADLVTTATGQISTAVNVGLEDINHNISVGKDGINSAVEKGKLEISEHDMNNISVEYEGAPTIWLNNLPCGITHTLRMSADGMGAYTGTFPVYCEGYGVEDMGIIQPTKIVDLEAGSTIIRDGNRADSQFIIIRNNANASGFIVSYHHYWDEAQQIYITNVSVKEISLNGTEV